MAKKVIIKKPIPISIKEAIQKKKDWMKEIQSGNIFLPNSKPKRIA